MIASIYSFGNEYRIIGMRRSGQHAIANWIIRQTRGSAWYINDINPNQSIDDLNNPRSQPGQWYTDGFEQETRTSTFSDNLVYNHEDWKVSDIQTVNTICQHDQYIGTSNIRYDVLVLRDPCNLFASRYYFRSGMPQDAQRWQWNDVDLWKSHAREFLGKTSHLENRKVVISFNQWVEDPAYRAALAGMLGLEFTDRGVNDVWHIGSTFDVKRFDGQANRMDTSGRWKHAARLPEFLDIFRDNEVIELSQEIFGMTQATNYITQSLARHS